MQARQKIVRLAGSARLVSARGSSVSSSKEVLLGTVGGISGFSWEAFPHFMEMLLLHHEKYCASLNCRLLKNVRHPGEQSRALLSHKHLKAFKTESSRCHHCPVLALVLVALCTSRSQTRIWEKEDLGWLIGLAKFSGTERKRI